MVDYMELDIPIFINKYEKEIMAAGDELGYWDSVLRCLKEERYLEIPQVDLIRKIVFHQESVQLIETTGEVGKKRAVENILANFKWLEDIRCRKDLEEYDELFTKILEKKQYSFKNESIETIYQRTRQFFVLCQIFNDKYVKIKEIYENKICYRKYADASLAVGEHRCYSRFKDLFTSNVYWKGFLKKVPEDLKDIVEYGYDVDGRLIMCKYYNLYNGGWNPCVFFIYVDEWLLRQSCV